MVKIHNLYNMTYYVHTYEICNINHMYTQQYDVIITYLVITYYYYIVLSLFCPEFIYYYILCILTILMGRSNKQQQDLNYPLTYVSLHVLSRRKTGTVSLVTLPLTHFAIERY